MWRRPTALLALPLALAACDGTDPAARRSPEVVVARTGSPEPWTGRTPNPADCGTWTLPQGGRLPAGATECLSGALRDRQPARMRVTAPTTEGDPITTDYLVRVDGRVEVTVDSRRDRFGARRIERLVCTGSVKYAPVPTFPTCSTPAPV
ncbi:DUF4362 domain-containing protein [Micromonospora soli]|uniref:DUF4362 domain-containing protein n=1 Tax=Micromonospora sp. NBRC 110009 TaxID=3061627 RepID=UPI002673F526|nr:DUF4362 domain-containing protein [Micromonospora sp. NBRC 110009]WKT96251.1 DUF4362 domain-containing protein [Micromonospora sp. NBRC 110009]